MKDFLVGDSVAPADDVEDEDVDEIVSSQAGAHGNSPAVDANDQRGECCMKISRLWFDFWGWL